MAHVDMLPLEVMRQLAGRGVVSSEAQLLAAIGAENNFLNLPHHVKEEYDAIATDVSQSSDVLVAITPAVDAFNSCFHGTVSPMPLHLWYCLYRACGWTVVGDNAVNNCVTIYEKMQCCLFEI